MVGVKLDTFNDSRKAFKFYVNPRGIQADLIVDDHTGKTDKSWDAIWSSAGQLTETGFEVEIQIPFKALRFNGGATAQQWGIELTRVWPREVEHEFSSQSKDRQISCDLCQLKKVTGFKNLTSPQNITLIPSLTFLTVDKRDQQTGRWQTGSLEQRESLDLRWGVSQNTFVNATINPDYSQIEADALQLDVNILSALSLDEKRPFFLDGMDYFNNWSRLVYTRIFEEPEYGVKYTGKSDRHSLGVISLKDKHTNFFIPYSQGSFEERMENRESENLVVRYRYDLGEKGNLGMTLTDRSGESYRNQVVGVDGKKWLGESDFIKFQAFRSDSEYPQELVDKYESEPGLVEPQMSDNAYSINYTYEGRNWEWLATYHQFGKDFRADSGFLSFSNWKQKVVRFTRIWFPEEDNLWWKEFSILPGWRVAEEIDGDKLYEESYINLEVDALYESTFGLGLASLNRFYEGQKFAQDEYLLWGEFNPWPNLNLLAEWLVTDAIDYDLVRAGKTDTLTAIVEYQLSDKLSSEIEYIRQNFKLPEGELYNIELVNFKLAYQIDHQSFIRLVLRNSGVDYGVMDPDENTFVGNQLIYSYKVNPFTLFFLGYTDNADDNRGRLQLQNKSWFMKFSYAWQR